MQMPTLVRSDRASLEWYANSSPDEVLAQRIDLGSARNDESRRRATARLIGEGQGSLFSHDSEVNPNELVADINQRSGQDLPALNELYSHLSGADEMETRVKDMAVTAALGSLLVTAYSASFAAEWASETTNTTAWALGIVGVGVGFMAACVSFMGSERLVSWGGRKLAKLALRFYDHIGPRDQPAAEPEPGPA